MKKVIGFGIALAPFAALAQTTGAGSLNSIESVISKFGGLINAVVPLLFAFATVWLLWNIVKYIEAGTGDPKTRDAARDAIILAIVLLFVMISVWGLVRILQGSFDLDTSQPVLPTPFVDSSAGGSI